MVDVGRKPEQDRRAVAAGRIVCQAQTIAALKEHALPKGDALAVARIAAIQAAKRTPELIPLAHPLAITKITINFDVQPASNSIECCAQVETHGQTGVEMEALTAVQIGLLTIYDMCKAADRGMVIGDVRLLEKHGGKSGSYVAGA